LGWDGRPQIPHLKVCVGKKLCIGLYKMTIAGHHVDTIAAAVLVACGDPNLKPDTFSQ